MNVVALIGNLATDIELRDVAPEKKVASFLLAVDRRRQGRGRGLHPGCDVGPAGRGRATSTCRRDRRSRSTDGCGAVRGRTRTASAGAPSRSSRTGSTSSTRAPARSRPSRPSRHRIGGQWPAGTTSSRTPTSCSRSRRSRSTGAPGLQVVGADEVTKVACGVSSSRELFERAAAAGAQLVLVHHGLFWRNEPLLVDAAAEGTTPGAVRRQPDARRLPPCARRASRARQQRAARRPTRRAARGRVRRYRCGGRASPSAMTIESSPRSSRTRRAAEPLVFAEGPERIQRVAVVTGGGGTTADRGGARGLRRARHGRTGRAGAPHRTGARDPLPGRRPLRDRDVRREGARSAPSGRVLGLDWEFLDLPNPV